MSIDWRAAVGTATAELRYVSTLGALEAPHAEGRVIAYCDQPQVCIETPDGERIWWRADLAHIKSLGPDGSGR